MKEQKKKFLLVIPYWRDKQHLGSVRVDRFIRWMNGVGYSSIIVCGGNRNCVEPGKYGKEIVIKDPLGVFF